MHKKENAKFKYLYNYINSVEEQNKPDNDDDLNASTNSDVFDSFYEEEETFENNSDLDL